MSAEATVVGSVNAPAGDRCVDVFRRAAGTFGFEEYRLDAEDAKGWFPIGGFADETFATADAAWAEARKRVAWLGAMNPDAPC